MTIAYKFDRVRRWGDHVGLTRAASFEIRISLRPRSVPLRPPGLAAPLRLRPRTSDISIFEAVFIEDEYGPLTGLNPKVVIDGGANVGISTVRLAQLFPDATIVAVEPDDANFAQLTANTRHLKNVIPVRAGLWHVSGRLAIENPGAEPWSLRCRPTDTDDPDGFDGMTIQGLLAANGLQHCDILKLDIEGAEHALFENAGDWIGRVHQAVMLEVHSDKTAELVQRTCPAADWATRVSGEKILLTRKSPLP